MDGDKHAAAAAASAEPTTTASTTSTLYNKEFAVGNHEQNYNGDTEKSPAGHEQQQQIAPQNAYEDDEEITENIIKEATAANPNLTRTSSIVYIEGPKLYALLGSMTLIFFLVMLDISIVSTVGTFMFFSFFHRDGLLITDQHRLFHTSPVTSTR